VQSTTFLDALLALRLDALELLLHGVVLICHPEVLLLLLVRLLLQVLQVLSYRRVVRHDHVQILKLLLELLFRLGHAFVFLALLSSLLLNDLHSLFALEQIKDEDKCAVQDQGQEQGESSQIPIV